MSGIFLTTTAYILLLNFSPLFCTSNENRDSSEIVYFGDPFILNDNGVYYLYGTGGSDGIKVYSSTDLITWYGPLGATRGLSLYKEDVWGEKNFWAPEVYRRNGKYYMFYSADYHIAVAKSDSPLGPFVQQEKKMLSTKSSAIDHHLFVDGDKKYIFYVSFEPHGLEVWFAELEDDLMSIKTGTEARCLARSQQWEYAEGSAEEGPGVNEGPFILKNDDYYYLIYSGNGYTSQDYGIGFAVSKSIQGPWVKHPDNPILQKPGNLVGVGHCSFFYDKEQKLKIVYHSHYNKQRIHPRIVHINNVQFVKDQNYDYKVIKIEFNK